MKEKILMLVIGILIGAIIASAGFLIYIMNGGNVANKGERNFDSGKFKGRESMQAPGFSDNENMMDFSNFDPNNMPNDISNIPNIPNMPNQ
ncbi:MAG: hypothetical protein J6M60_03730 [Clostridia bacterium]|nr:hypothetical protein [Clostridia bacterium]